MVFDIRTNALVGQAILAGSNPHAIAITPDGTRAYVAASGDNSVSVIDTATNTVIGAPIPVGNNPFAIAIAPVTAVQASESSGCALSAEGRTGIAPMATGAMCAIVLLGVRCAARLRWGRSYERRSLVP